MEESTDLLAVRPAFPPELRAVSQLLERFPGLRSVEVPEGIVAEELEAFSRAGWLFVPRTPELFRAITARRAREWITHVGRLYRDEAGRTLIGTDRLTVRLKPEVAEERVRRIFEEKDLDLVRTLRFALNLFEVRIKSERDPLRDPLTVAEELHDDALFLYAEPQMIEHIPTRYKPSDPDYGRQWQWNNDGKLGTRGADVEAEAAWDLTRGFGTRVAVVDIGFDLNHPDLQGSVAAAAGYFEGDGRDVRFVNKLDGFPSRDHGTFCAGMAVARANNGLGGCGISPEAELLPIACLIDEVGDQNTLARAISYAANPALEVSGLTPDDGADVISCSIGPPGPGIWIMQSVLEEAINYAVTNGRRGKGTPIFWAVCNETFPISNDEVCSDPKVIAVGRSGCDDKEDGSAFGPELEFLAPGVNVFSTVRAGGYATKTGTSYAAPCAAGIASLILALDRSPTWTEVREIIRDTCEKIGGVNYKPSGHNNRYGYGRVNAAKAVDSVKNRLGQLSRSRENEKKEVARKQAILRKRWDEQKKKHPGGFIKRRPDSREGD